MPKKTAHPVKDLYRELRALPWLRLWEQEVPRFNLASPDEKLRTVALIRAIGAGFTEAVQPSLKEPVRQWLLSLLADPAEKIRRYAMTALPKIGAGRTEERQLLSLLSKNQGRSKRRWSSPISPNPPSWIQ